MSGVPLTGENEGWMIVASLLIAIAASYTALDLTSRIAVAGGRVRAAWLAAGSCAMGAGIWSMHFVAMLGYRLPIAVSYDVPLVGLSILEAISASVIGLAVVSRPRYSWGVAGIAALSMGAAIVAMHYTGMAALRFDARQHHEPWLVAASCAIAVVASGAAMWLAFHLREERSRVALYRLAAAVVMGFAIAGMHYTAMAGLRLTSAGSQGAAESAHSVPGSLLASTTIFGTLVILAGTLLVTTMDRRRRAAAETRVMVPPGLLWSCLGLTMLAVVSLVVLQSRTNARLHRDDVAAARIAQQVSELRFLDEALTMTAYAEAASGDRAWWRRYDTLGAQLSGVLDRLGDDVPRVDGAPAQQRLRQENDRMLTLEHAARDRSATHRDGAMQLLTSPDYRRAKAQYAYVLQALTDSIAGREVAVRRSRDAAAALGVILATGTVLLIAVAWAGILGTLRTALARSTAHMMELAAAKALAESANRSKGEFLAQMSHELRTPLSAVIGFANILHKNKKGRLSSADLVYVDRIRNGGRHLLGLINEILDLAKLESGQSEMTMAPADLRDLVREAASLVDSRLEDTGLRLVLDLSREPVPVVTDGARVTQVLINLLGNAIKFTEVGTVTVRVLHARSGRGPSIEVADTGIGIPAERLSGIFNAFEQAENGTSRMYGGTGLGLAISRSIADALGGSLTVRSELAAGSTFTLAFPVEASASASAGPETADLLPRGAADAVLPSPSAAAAAARGGATRKTVLVIDDDADAREIIALQVQEAGARAVLAASGEEGLRMARASRPDAITLDLLMPGMSGMDVLHALKSDPLLCAVPVIVVSVAAAEAGSLLGAVDVVEKPLDRDDLRRALARQLGSTHEMDVLVVEDDAATRELLREQLLEAGVSRVHMAADGREALQLMEHQTPQLVLLDLMMPGMGGLAFLRALRLDVRWVHLPVVVVSGRTLDDADARLLERETRAVVMKGDDIGERLARTLRMAMGRTPHEESDDREREAR